MDQPEARPTGLMRVAEDVDSRDKSIRKKKSLPRLFILSRKKSFKSRPSSPLQVTEDAHPMPTSRNGPSSAIRPRQPSSKSASPSTYSEDFKFRGSGGATGLDSNDCSPRDLTGAALQGAKGGTLKGKDHVQSEGLPNDTSSIDQRLRKPSTSWPLPEADDQPSMSRRALKRSPSGITPGGHTLAERVQPLNPQSDDPFLPRPHTAFQTTFPHRDHEDPQQTPMHVRSARNANEQNLVQRRSPIPDNWVGWKSSYNRAEVRESIRSGLSSGSSQPESGGTEHSSIFTKLSSISDNTTYGDLEDFQPGKHSSMTVDDAIDLYSAGFEDDGFDLPEEVPMNSTGEDEAQRRSLRIAEAMNDTIDSVMMMPPPPPLGTPETRDSTAIISGDFFRSVFPRPPPLRAPTASHDQYGFRKWSRDITLAQYDAWYTEYAEIQERRCQKWTFFLQDQGLSTKQPTRFPARSVKTQRFIRKGLPPAWRGDAWFYYAGGDAYLRKHPDLYAELVLKSQTPKLSTNDKESIERDLHRTFPDNIHFKLDQPTTPTTETPLLSSLRRVLCAFAIHHPRTGYCQSLNFVAGLLLLFLPEEKAFWMLHIITTFYLPGTHEISLEGANVDLWVLMLALKEAVPSIWSKVGGEVNTSTTRLPPISLCTTSWFMSLFIGTLPIESVLRVWDVLFYEGSRSLFRVALAIFKLGETEIRNVSDPMEIFQVVQQLPRKILAVSGLMAVACRRGGVSQAWVEKKRKERRDWYARERAVEKVRKDSSVGRRESKDRKSSRDDGALGDFPEEEELPEQVVNRARTFTGWRGRVRFGKG